MNLWNRILPASVLVPLLLAASGLRAEEKIDLDRVDPVPGNTPIPVMDFFRPQILRSPKLNRTGTHLAAIITPGLDHTELLVYNLLNQKIERLGSHGDSDMENVYWLNEKRLIYYISVKKRGTIGLYAANVGALTSSYPLVQWIGSHLIAVPPDDRTHPLVHLAANSLNTGQYGEVVTVRSDIDTGLVMDFSKPGLSSKDEDDMTENNNKHITVRHPVMKTNEGSDFRYLADKEGKLAFGFEYGDKGEMFLNQLNGENWTRCPEDLDEIVVVDCGDNPGEIVVVGPRQDDKPRPLEFMDAATGKPGDVLLQDKAYDFDGWLYRDPVSHNIVGAMYDRSAPTTVWFNEEYRGLQKVLENQFPGQVVRILGTDDSGKIVLISTSSDRQPPIYSWVNLEKRTAGLFKNSAPWIDPKRMQPKNLMKFKTRDGRVLDAYVTMPAGATRQNPPPLVVLPHDGPYYRNSFEFDAEAQFFASRGYAVLQPNYRGSSGYNWMFPTTDEWAYRKMHEDVTEATKTLLASGLVDAKRTAIVGTSFGGFLAMSGAAFEPGLYRCAVGIAPILDWRLVLEDQKYYKYSWPYFTRMKYKLGNPATEREKFDAIAPGQHGDQVRSAVLIFNGEFDLTVNLNADKDMVSAVRHNNFPAEVVTFINEGETVEHLDHKVKMYSKIEEFLAKNLAP